MLPFSLQELHDERFLERIQKVFRCKVLLVLSTTCVSLMAQAQYTLSHWNDVEGCFSRGVCHHVIVGFLLVFFSDPSIFPHLVYGRVWPIAL